MVPLINEKDNLVLNESDFPSNAMFYKDMIAFADAYNTFIGNGVKKLPNYCYFNRKIYLDGICLLIKDYSSEFDFETLDLTMEYLKVLYYASASFSVDGKFPEKSLIEDRYEEKKYINKELFSNTSALADTTKSIYDDALYKYEVQMSLNNKSQLKANIFSKISIILLVVGLGFAVLFETLGFAKVLDMLVAITVSVVFLVFAVGSFALCRVIRRKQLKQVEDSQNETNALTEDKNEKLESLKQVVERKNKINNEIYNYIYCINNMDLLNNDTDYKMILKIATQYNMLSYNLEYDVANTFDSHDNDIQSMVKTLDEIPNNDELFNNLNKCYLDIVRKNWLYYSRFVRYSFIEKMVVCGKRTHNWQVYYDDKFVDPFNINIKSIAEENTAFLENEESLFVEMPINRIFKIPSVKEDKSLRIKKDATIEELKNVKMAYANKFYNLEEIKKISNMFYSDSYNKANKNKTIDMVLIDGKNVIPDLFLIKINLIEARKKYEDSHLPVIAELYEKILLHQDNPDDDEILEYTDENADEMEILDLIELTDSNVNCESIEELEDGSVEYIFNGKKLIGYRF